MADHDAILSAVKAHVRPCFACGDAVVVYHPPQGPRAKNPPKPIQFEPDPVDPGKGRYVFTPNRDGSLNGSPVKESMGANLQRDGYPLFEPHKNNCRNGERKPR